jgi:hypothetical protein
LVVYAPAWPGAAEFDAASLVVCISRLVARRGRTRWSARCRSCTNGLRLADPLRQRRRADLERLAGRIDSWRGELPAYFDTDRISNGPTKRSTC